MTRREALAPAALAAGAVLAYGGPAFFRLGFYHDDWHFLAVLKAAPPGFMAGVRALLAADPVFALRPGDAPLFSLLWRLSGENPLGWQAALLAANLAAAFFVARLLREFGVPRTAAALGALLALAYPTKDSALFWPTLVISPLALACFLGATAGQAAWARRGDRAALAAGLAAFAAALCVYEHVMFLLPAWLLLPRGSDPGARRRSAAGLAAAAAAAAALLVYKFAVVPRVWGVVFNKPMIFTPENAAVVALRAAEANFGWRMPLGALRGVWWAFVYSPLTLLAAAALPWGLRKALPDPAPEEGASPRALALFGGAVAVLGYLPLLVSDYRPAPLGEMNRLNLVSSVGLSMALCAPALDRARSAAWGRALAGAAALALAAHVGFAGMWAEAYALQMDMKAVLLSHLDKWPAGKVLVMKPSISYVDHRAPVMVVHWAATGAARVWTGDPSRRADVIRPGLIMGAAGVTLGDTTWPWESVVFLDMAQRDLTTLSWRGKAPS